MEKQKISKKVLQGMKTKQKIYDVAMELFIRKGYSNVSVNDIIEKANSSKGGFYRHYESKVSLLYEILNQIDRAYCKYYNENLKDNPLDATDKIKLFSLYALKLNLESLPVNFMAEILSFSLNSNSGVNNKMDTKRPYFHHMEILIKEGLEKKTIKNSIDVNELIQYIITLHRGAIYNYSIQEEYFEPTQFLEKMLTLLMNDIRS